MIALNLLALAAAALAVPTAPTDKEFTMTFSYGGKNLSVCAVCNGTAGEYVLVGDPSAAVGTPAFLRGINPNQTLHFVVDNEIYNAIVPGVGDYYGHALPVTAEQGVSQPQWESYNGDIGHQLQAALDVFYACERDVNGQTALVLSYGIPNSTNFHSPPGCSETEMYQKLNIPGGLTTPS